MSRTTSAPRVTVQRKIDASADDLFAAWLDPASLAMWMRPGDITHSTATVDPKVGGTFEIVMYSPEGSRVHSGTYRVIDRPRRLVFTWISPGTKQTETLVMVEFRVDGRTTEVVLTHEQLPDDSAVLPHTMGWTRILELLSLQPSWHEPADRQPNTKGDRD